MHGFQCSKNKHKHYNCTSQEKYLGKFNYILIYCLILRLFTKTNLFGSVKKSFMHNVHYDFTLKTMLFNSK